MTKEIDKKSTKNKKKHGDECFKSIERRNKPAKRRTQTIKYTREGERDAGGKHQVIGDQVRLTSNGRKNKARVDATGGNLQNKTGNTNMIAAHDMTEIWNTNHKG